MLFNLFILFSIFLYYQKGKSTTITFAIQFLGNIATTLDLKFRVTCDLKKDDVDVYYEISNLKITDM